MGLFSLARTHKIINMKTKLNDRVKDEYLNYRRTKAMVDCFKPTVKKVVDDLKDLKLWTATFGSDQRILFMYYSINTEPANLADFKKVCDSVEKHFNVTLEKEFDDFLGVGSEFIEARADIGRTEHKGVYFCPSVTIRMFGVDKCEIEYEEVVVKKPHLVGFCAEAIKS